MFPYRPDQGIYARGTSFWVLIALAVFSGRRFNFEIQAWGDWSVTQLTGRIPVLGFPLTPAFLLGLAVFGGFAYAAWRVVNWAKLADILIDTEAEMKRVSWPSFEDSKAASLVVIGCVAFMLAFLGLADLALQWVFRTLVY